MLTYSHVVATLNIKLIVSVRFFISVSRLGWTQKKNVVCLAFA